MNARMALRRRSPLALALCSIVLLAGLGGSAQAAVVGLERAGGATAFTSANKSLTASCPAGKRLLGTGADLAGGFGEVGIVEMVPNAALTGASVRAVEDGNGFGPAWSLGGSALCSAPLPGLQRVASTSPTNSSNKGVSAACPAGKRLLGTGFAITGGGGQVVLRELIPNSGLTAVSAFGAEDENGFTGNWSITAYAICTNPVAGLQRVVATSATNSNDDKLAVASCPAGKRVTGVGGKLTGAAGQVSMDDLIPFPNPATSVQVAGIEDENGATANWSAAAYAICANGAERVVVESPSGTGGKEVIPQCSEGMQVTGLGGDITGGFGQVMLQELLPAPDRAFVIATSDATGTTNNWTLRGYSICATPPPGVERAGVASAFDNSSPKTVLATCPAGKKVLGAGGTLPDPLGDVVMEDLIPTGALTGVQVTASELFPGIDDNWEVDALAVCANPPPGLERVVASSASDSEELKVVTATCPAGKHLLGTGAETVGAGDVVLDDLRPNAALTDVTVTGIEAEHGQAGDWSVRAYAVCANY